MLLLVIPTVRGDVFYNPTGSTIAKFFGSYHLEDFDITPYRYSEFRIEFFKPHYILGPHPTWAYVPTMVSYGETFIVKLAANTSATSIKAVVMGDPGTTTHSSNMGTRMNQLAYNKVDDQTLEVAAPANSFLATPSELDVFVVWQLVKKNDALKVPWQPFMLSTCSLPGPCVRAKDKMATMLLVANTSELWLK